jgi:hypothetical protein
VICDKGELRNEVWDMAAIGAILKNDLGVKQDYRHAPKSVTSGESVEINGAVLKWYGLHPEDRPLPGEIYKDGEAMADFALWPCEGTHKPTFCVWELAPVWHEKESWERFLISARDETAAQAWQRDLYVGSA